MSTSNAFNPAQRIELTERQEAVVRLIAAGLTNGEIAERLGLSLDGVKWHVREILGKFGVDSREDAARLWRERRSPARRVRMWSAAVLGSGPLRWVSLVSITGVGGVAAVVGAIQLRADDVPPVRAKAAVVELPDPATNDGLTLRIEKVVADDTQTVVTFTLEGRPELGRISGPPQGIVVDAATGRLADQVPLELRDQDGRTFGVRSAGAVDGAPRRWAISFGPVFAETRTLTLQMAGVPFVAPAFETSLGERPADPSAVIDGPWVATVFDIEHTAAASVTVDHTPRPFGDGTVILDEVLQTSTDTVVRAHLAGSTLLWGPYWRPTAVLTGGSGTAVAPAGGSWGDGPGEIHMEFRFQRTTGPATFTLTGGAGLSLSEEDIAANIASQNLDAERAATFRHRMAEIAAASESAGASFEGQPPVTWTFTLP